MGEVMPLTPEDVSNKRFTPVRLREGYDMGEVDQFLDEVEAELARLTKENDDLRSKLSAAQQVRHPGRRDGARARCRRPPSRSPSRSRARARSRPRCSGGRGRGRLGRDDPRRDGPPGLQRRRATARDRDAQRRRAGRGSQERGRQDRRRGPHQGRAPGVRVQDQGRPARGRRPHPLPDARLRDRRASPADVR